jgi:prophage antirepressor-like protein|nr:MAG TPA_asm: repressor domain protein [Caudoviricetes sp.]DAV03072.1 MAG TPA: repressor domain protein [Caudoviricetes sp.]
MQLSLSENIKIFNNAEFGDIRVMLIDDDPWFVGKDIAVALGYNNPQKAIRDHVDEQDRGVNEMDTPGGKQPIIIINESGLYSLIFSSKLESAQRFKHWVTHDVLPSIRKHGMYMTGNLLETAIANPDFVIGLIQNMKAEKEKNAALQTQNKQLCEKNEEMQPKADYFDDLVAWNLAVCFRGTAKELRIPERKFIQSLIEDGYIYRDKNRNLLPKAGKGDELFVVKEFLNRKNKHGGLQTRVTPKGRETFRLLYASIRKSV